MSGTRINISNFQTYQELPWIQFFPHQGCEVHFCIIINKQAEQYANETVSSRHSYTWCKDAAFVRTLHLVEGILS